MSFCTSKTKKMSITKRKFESFLKDLPNASTANDHPKIQKIVLPITNQDFSIEAYIDVLIFQSHLHFSKFSCTLYPAWYYGLLNSTFPKQSGSKITDFFIHIWSKIFSKAAATNPQVFKTWKILNPYFDQQNSRFSIYFSGKPEDLIKSVQYVKKKENRISELKTSLEVTSAKTVNNFAFRNLSDEKALQVIEMDERIEAAIIFDNPYFLQSWDTTNLNLCLINMMLYTKELLLYRPKKILQFLSYQSMITSNVASAYIANSTILSKMFSDQNTLSNLEKQPHSNSKQEVATYKQISENRKGASLFGFQGYSGKSSEFSIFYWFDQMDSSGLISSEAFEKFADQKFDLSLSYSDNLCYYVIAMMVNENFTPARLQQNMLKSGLANKSLKICSDDHFCLWLISKYLCKIHLFDSKIFDEILTIFAPEKSTSGQSFDQIFGNYTTANANTIEKLKIYIFLLNHTKNLWNGDYCKIEVNVKLELQNSLRSIWSEFHPWITFTNYCKKNALTVDPKLQPLNFVNDIHNNSEFMWYFPQVNRFNKEQSGNFASWTLNMVRHFGPSESSSRKSSSVEKMFLCKQIEVFFKSPQAQFISFYYLLFHLHTIGTSDTRTPEPKFILIRQYLIQTILLQNKSYWIPSSSEYIDGCPFWMHILKWTFDSIPYQISFKSLDSKHSTWNKTYEEETGNRNAKWILENTPMIFFDLISKHKENFISKQKLDHLLSNVDKLKVSLQIQKTPNDFMYAPISHLAYNSDDQFFWKWCASIIFCQNPTDTYKSTMLWIRLTKHLKTPNDLHSHIFRFWWTNAKNPDNANSVLEQISIFFERLNPALVESTKILLNQSFTLECFQNIEFKRSPFASIFIKIYK